MTCPRNTEQEILIPAFFAVESISVPPSVSHCLGRCSISSLRTFLSRTHTTDQIYNQKQLFGVGNGRA